MRTSPVEWHVYLSSEGHVYRMNPLGLRPERFVVALQPDGEIAGFCQLSSHGDSIRELRSLYVKPESRCACRNPPCSAAAAGEAALHDAVYAVHAWRTSDSDTSAASGRRRSLLVPSVLHARCVQTVTLMAHPSLCVPVVSQSSAEDTLAISARLVCAVLPSAGGLVPRQLHVLKHSRSFGRSCAPLLGNAAVLCCERARFPDVFGPEDQVQPRVAYSTSVAAP